ncbi:hypothetical protein G6F57_000966 [Rhizopus arrhizus]|uniref:C2H2-type domain-containing protein n=1 Tax=Rhizopus oryzae TaxID=64495 RepID=A0A9P6XJR4_RHIOR|nr:hypothetical protein G6F23_003839 [Rhizopus arrhizus]KAG1247691.1 hypothetical protein G6F68_014096 [Rhizopus microsporus]KAG1418095.1 hypothetical protein G6F58_005215 [Rhizopus delemar]KAG0770290.1 hypothetical protein G6F24_000351 [Rhizopus arrhizus]KAG0795201.1 hypothetical protein G6F21_002285 [Rhizopus arrhizus]
MSFNYSQDYLDSSITMNQENHCHHQQQQQPMEHYDIDTLLMHDITTELLPTPQLYHSPVPNPSYPDQQQQEWLDPPIEFLLNQNQQRNEGVMDEKRYVCPICDHRHNMVEHMLTHDPNRPKLFACQICQRAFARKYDMKRHEKIHFR